MTRALINGRLAMPWTSRRYRYAEQRSRSTPVQKIQRRPSPRDPYVVYNNACIAAILWWLSRYKYISDDSRGGHAY